jgi:hypothetical protein
VRFGQFAGAVGGAEVAVAGGAVGSGGSAVVVGAAVAVAATSALNIACAASDRDASRAELV